MTQEEHTPGRPLDEVYDTQRDVEQDPYGAWQAIQTLSAERDALKAELAEAVETLSLIAVVGFSSDLKVSDAIAKQVVNQARAFLARHKKGPSHD